MANTSMKERESRQQLWPPRYVRGIQQLSPLMEEAFQRTMAEGSRIKADNDIQILSCVSGIEVLSMLQSSVPLKRQLRLHLKLHDLGKDYDLDDITCEKVTNFDSRITLRNGWKVVAQRDFGALEVVGPYKGWVSSLKEYEDAIPLIQRLQFEQYLVSTSSTIDLLKNGKGTLVISWKTGKIQLSLLVSGTGLSWREPLLVCAHPRPDCANVLSEINDAITVSEDGEATPCSGAKNNCEIVEIGWRGWIYVFIVTVRNVSKGDELTVTYGEDYWRGIQSVKCQHKEVKECMRELADKVALLENSYDVLRGKAPSRINCRTLGFDGHYHKGKENKIKENNAVYRYNTKF